MSDITARIADILEATPAARHPMAFATGRDWANFVAEQIVAQLQLTPEVRYSDPRNLSEGTSQWYTVDERHSRNPMEWAKERVAYSDGVVQTRLVTPWVLVEGEK